MALAGRLARAKALCAYTFRPHRLPRPWGLFYVYPSTPYQGISKSLTLFLTCAIVGYNQKGPAMREWWTPSELRNAARLLEHAASNIETTFPHSARNPNPTTLEAAKCLIKIAIGCIEASQPTKV